MAIMVPTRVHQFVMQTFSGARVVEDWGEGALREAFRRELKVENYSCSATTIEQVFLQMVRQRKREKGVA
jgi:hypothetical protein